MVLRFASIFLASLVVFANGVNAGGTLCGSKRVCGDMTTCAEAVYYNTQCGLSDLDRDGDGIPCEKMCGKTLATMRARVEAQPYSRSLTAQLLPDAAPDAGFTCGSKHTCTEMASCREATFYLNACGASTLDRDHDGVPCEGLCR